MIVLPKAKEMKRTFYVDGRGGEPVVKDPNAVAPIVLCAFKNIAVRPFSLPFSEIAKVRGALRLALRPLLGDAADEVSFTPLFFRRDHRSSEGTVFIMTEIDIDGANVGTQANSVWPMPLVFASEVNGRGAIICRSNGECYSMILDNWVPRWFGYSSESHKDNKVIDTVKNSAESLGLTDIQVFEADVDSFSDTDIQVIGEKTLEMCPTYAALDLSDRGTTMLEINERILASATSVARLAMISGAICLLLTAALFFISSDNNSNIDELPKIVYERIFGERSNQPLASSRANLRSLNSGGSITLLDVSRSISAAWEDSDISSDITLESMRYGNDNTDITGTSANNEQIQRLRSMLADDGYSVRIDNIQRIPGGSMRFNMSLTRAQR